MSVVASFVTECAQNGRWVRGVLALRRCLHSEEVDIVKARVQLATMVLEKHWCTALSMVQSSDVSQVDLLCRFLYVCSKSTHVPSDVFGNVTATLLHSARKINETQNSLFLSSIKWTPWHQAVQFFELLESPQERSIRELTEWLKYTRTFADSRKRQSIDSILLQLSSTRYSHVDSWKHKKPLPNNALQTVDIALRQGSELGVALNSLKPGEFLAMRSVMSLARAAMRGGSLSWKLPLSLVAGHRVVGDFNEVLAKMIGICCPQLWCAALGHFKLGGKLALWLASCHSWRAGLLLSQFLPLSSREKYDILSRCATPLSSLKRLTLVAGATKRIPAPTTRCIASELAKGYILEELQLSAFSKACQRAGNWESAIHLFHRVPTHEFQRRAVQCLLENCPGIAIEQLLRLVSERHPANTSTASILIAHSRDWMEALYVLRYVMAQGTPCNPKILSALMDVQPPLDILSVILGKLRSAANKGILYRLRSLEEELRAKQKREGDDASKL